MDLVYQKNEICLWQQNVSYPQVYDKHPVSTDGGTWYPQACKFLKLDHRINSSYEKASLLKEQYNISKIEPSDLMTIFHAKM